MSKQPTNWIREARKAQGLSQKQLASMASLSPAAVSIIETGVVSPGVPALYRIAYALGNGPLTEALAPFVNEDGESLYRRGAKAGLVDENDDPVLFDL